MTATPKYDMAVYPVQLAVRSQSDGAAVHMVTLPYCDCPDFTNRKGKGIETEGGQAITVCKHLLAGLERVGGWHREDPSSTVYTDVTSTRARTILTAAGVYSGVSRAALNDAVHGHPCNLPGTSERGPIRVEETGPRTGTRKYTITLYPVSKG